MAPTSTIGRPQSKIQEYVQEFNTDDDNDGMVLYCCKGDGCNNNKKQKAGSSFQTTRWVEHVVKVCAGLDMDVKLQIAESSKAEDIKKWLEDYKREQAMHGDPHLEAGTQEQAMSQTVARGPWKRDRQETSDTNKRPCFQSTLDTHGNFDRCDEARAKTITAAITVFLVGCAIPFSIVESSFFLKMIESLNKGYLHHLPKDDAVCHTHNLLTLFNDTVREMRCCESMGMLFSQWDLMDTLE
jgi:hypothetical protein